MAPASRPSGRTWMTVLGFGLELLCGVRVSGQVCVSPVDIVMVLDRSVSVGETNWNNQVLPAVRELVNIIDPRTDALGQTRLALVVFPGFERDGSPSDDRSGGASTVISMTANKAQFTDMLDAADAIASGAGCQSGSTPSSSMSYPCGGWGATPTWLALSEADNILYTLNGGNGARKLVVVITDGAPSNTKSGL